MIGFQPGFSTSREMGIYGEKKAAEYLKENGYRILETNYRCRIGEVDIIAEQSEFMAFVEVKSRMASDKQISPFISLTKQKTKRIRKIGEYYLVQNNIRDRQPRFDVIGVIFSSKRQFTVEHIENAF